MKSHTGYEQEERERDRIYASLRDHILRPACQLEHIHIHLEYNHNILKEQNTIMQCKNLEAMEELRLLLVLSLLQLHLHLNL